jgi:uncharacterized repeat protein (TIGR01451 family)
MILLSSYAFGSLQYLEKRVVNETAFERVSTAFFADSHTSSAEYDDAIDEDVDIGFDFPFNGTTYSTVNIDSNGHLAFVDITSKFSNEKLPLDSREQSIYPYWDDLNVADGGSITYGTLGVGDDEHFIVYWKDVPRYGDSSKKYTLQVVLYKNGDIRFRYDSTSSVNGDSATIGVQESSSYYDQHSYNSTESFDATKDILYQLPLSTVKIDGTVPNCTNPIAKLEMSTYDTTGYNDYPDNTQEYALLIQDYAIDSKWLGSGYLSRIDGSGNPYGSDDNYLTIFEGYIYIPSTGTYKFGVDGDDAVELYLDDTLITGWYGGHGRANEAKYIVDVYAESGWHKLEYHHQEKAGGDNYYLYWQEPNGSMEIVPSSQFFHCSATVSKNSEVISDTVNGRENSKRIPGALIEYTIEAKNLGNIRISNTILRDTLASNLEWVVNSIEVSSPSINGGEALSLTDVNDGDNGSFDGSRVEVNCETLKENEVCLVKFRVKVK